MTAPDHRRSGPARLRLGSPDATAKRARRDPLSAERIVDVALAQITTRGYDAVSMRSIARELGTGPASLYAHVSSRDELDALVVERVAGALEIPDPDPERWREQIRGVMVDMLRLYDAHPGVARASLGLVPLSPTVLGVVERLTAILRAGGVPDQAIAWFLDMMVLYVSAVAVERDIERSRETHGGDPDAYYDQVHDYFASLPPAEFPVLASLAGAMTAGDADDRFGFGADLMVAGLSAFASGAVTTRRPARPGRDVPAASSSERNSGD